MRLQTKAVLALAGCALLLSGCNKTTASRAEVHPIAPLRLDGVTIVDTLEGKLTPGMSIVMDHGEITSIMPTSKATKTATIRTVDAAGKFVVPGYNNMHVHVLDQGNVSALLTLMLAEGVTGFRQMSGSPELLAKRRDGKLPLNSSTPALLAMPGDVLTPLNAGSLKQLQSEIRKQKRDGADFIKVGILDPQTFFAAIEESRRVGLPIAGHLQEGVDPAEASRKGFRSVEHLGPGDTVWIGCSANQAVLLAEAAQHPVMKTPRVQIPTFVQKLATPFIQKHLINPAAFEDAVDVERLQRAFDSYNETKCRALAATFVTNDTWQTPTLVRLRTQELADSPEYQTDPSLAFMQPSAVKQWHEVTDRFHRLPQVSLAIFRKAYLRQLALTKLLDEAGVKMMTGTDDGGQVPGQSLQQEFDELSKAGLAPLTVLRMTTLNPAIFLGRTDRMGTVRVGRNANLVLLDANPLESTRNLARISAVIRAGSYISRDDLNASRARVAAGNGHLD